MRRFDGFEPFSRRDERDDDDDRRPSWRELDRRRDRSSHREAEPESRDPRPSRQDYKKDRYKKQLEQLFSGGKPNPEQEKQLKKIRQARGDAEINKACLQFVKKFGLPKEWDSLTLFLDATDPELLLPALEQLEKSVVMQPPVRQENFKQRLRLLKMTSSSDKVLAAVARLLEKVE